MKKQDKLQQSRKRKSHGERFIGALLTICIALTLFPTSAFAGCPMDVLIGTNELFGLTRTFNIGQPFDGIGELYEHKKSGAIVHNKNREWWANGVSIKQGDVFTKPGQYYMKLRTDGLVANSYFQVMPKLNFYGFRGITVVTPPNKTNYRQGIDPFDPSGIVVRCNFADGKTQDLGYDQLEFYEVWPNYKPPHTFVLLESEPVIEPGYRFWRAGERQILIRVGAFCALVPIKVSPFVSSVGMNQQPSANKFGKGKVIRTSDYSVRATYHDGSIEIISGDHLRVTVNGEDNVSRMFAGNDYEITTIKSSVKLRMGDFTLPRDAEPGMCRVSPDNSPYDAPYRSAPNGSVIGSIPFGTVLEVVSIEGDWAKVNYQGGTYYVWATRLKKADMPITVTLNGKPITFDQSPIYHNGRTLVPLRAIFEAMGADIVWNGDTQTVTAKSGGTNISLTIGSNKLIKNGQNITLDVPAQLVGGRTLVPARAVAESFGADVNWNSNTKTVIITK